jgi:hypothetical protein
MGKKERPKETRNGYFFLDLLRPFLPGAVNPFFQAHPGAARHDIG